MKSIIIKPEDVDDFMESSLFDPLCDKSQCFEGDYLKLRATSYEYIYEWGNYGSKPKFYKRVSTSVEELLNTYENSIGIEVTVYAGKNQRILERLGYD